MSGFISLRGYGTVFNQIERHGRRLEFFDRAAIDPESSAYLCFGDHDAESICSPLALHVDSYGLGFIAAIREDIWASIRHGVTHGAVQYCSVNVVHEETEEVSLKDGSRCSRIVRARIDHVCLTSNPAYKGTGVWPSQVVGPMPPRLAALSARFELGRARWLAERRPAAKLQPVVRGPSMGASIEADRNFLASLRRKRTQRLAARARK